MLLYAVLTGKILIVEHTTLLTTWLMIPIMTNTTLNPWLDIFSSMFNSMTNWAHTWYRYFWCLYCGCPWFQLPGCLWFLDVFGNLRQFLFGVLNASRFTGTSSRFGTNFTFLIQSIFDGVTFLLLLWLSVTKERCISDVRLYDDGAFLFRLRCLCGVMTISLNQMLPAGLPDVAVEQLEAVGDKSVEIDTQSRQQVSRKAFMATI